MKHTTAFAGLLALSCSLALASPDHVNLHAKYHHHRRNVKTRTSTIIATVEITTTVWAGAADYTTPSPKPIAPEAHNSPSPQPQAPSQNAQAPASPSPPAAQKEGDAAATPKPAPSSPPAYSAKPAPSQEQPAPLPSGGSGPSGIVPSLKPHVEYGSSTGVIGCMIDTNRVAYWPTAPPCDNPCIRLTSPSGSTIHILHIDQSGGSYDISMDAFKTLKHGPSWRTTSPGAESPWEGVSYSYVPLSHCASVLARADGALPVLAKSPNMYFACRASDPRSSWATQVQFWDVDDAQCLRGVLQKCAVEGDGNTPVCANGAMAGQSGMPVLKGIGTVVEVTADGEEKEVKRPAV